MMRFINISCGGSFISKNHGFSRTTVNMWFVIAVQIIICIHFLPIIQTATTSKTVESNVNAIVENEQQYKENYNDCVETKCNCSIVSPKVTKLLVDQINVTTYTVSWEIPSDREFDNFSDIIFHLENAKIQRTYIPVHLNWATMKNDYLLLDLNLTEGTYTLEANFYNNYGCGLLLTSVFEVLQSTFSNETERGSYYNKSLLNATIFADTEINNKNLTVVVVCDTEERKLKLNLSWDKAAAPTIDYYEITYDNTPTEYLACSETVKFSYTYEGAPQVVVPPPNHSSNIFGNCTYGVSVHSYNKILPATLINIYTTKIKVPACLETCCNCTVFKPKLSNLSITRINLTKYIVSWDSDNSSENNFTSITFYVKNSDVPVLNVGPGSFNENYTILMFNITSGIFTLVADFINAYNCPATLSAKFGEVSDDYGDGAGASNYEEFILNYGSETSTDRKQSNSGRDYDYGVISADQITALSVNTFCDPVELVFKFNMTWNKPNGTSPPQLYTFMYEVISSDLHPCPEGHRFSYDYGDENTTQMIVPPPSYVETYKIRGNCSYQISVIGLNKQFVHNEGDIFITGINVPPCIGICCNCDILTPDPTNITIVQIGFQKFNVSWNIDYRKTGNNFTNISFDLYSPAMPLVDLGPEGFNQNFKIVEINITEGNYTLVVDFLNNFTCHDSLYIPLIVQQQTFQGTRLWIQLIVIFSVSVLILILLLCFFNRRTNVIKNLIVSRLRDEGRDVRNLYLSVPTTSNRKMENSNWLYIDQEIIEGDVDQYEYPRSRISLIKEIGKGAFGQVFLAKTVNNERVFQYVAIKTLRERAPTEEVDDFLSEIQILKKIGTHANIVTMIGCCTLKEPYMMMMEFVPCGDLKQYLLDLRDQWYFQKDTFLDNSESYIEPESPMSILTTSTRPSVTTQYTNLSEGRTPTGDSHFTFEIERVLDHNELQDFAFQIAKGMAHLESIPITHRDLAARNILINEYKTLKISDFGLSRTGPYINNKLKKLPLRWMSIEAIEDHFYDNKSDVWAFAVVLWEIGTLGGFPYENIPDNMLLYYLNEGKRLTRPEICTDDVYSLMLRCWSQDSKLRPSFDELVELLDTKKRRIYVDFSQLNPTYMFPPTKVEPRVVKSDEQKVKYIECP